MREGGKVGQCETGGFQPLRQGAVAGAAGDRDGARRGIDADAGVQVFKETSDPGESAMALNECREPRARIFEAPATTSWTSSRVRGRWIEAAV